MICRHKNVITVTSKFKFEVLVFHVLLYCHKPHQLVAGATEVEVEMLLIQLMFHERFEVNAAKQILQN